MQNYREQHFEEHIEEQLLNSGYIKRLSTEYDKDLCLIPSEVVAFIKATQPEEYAKLEQQYGADTPQKFCARLAREVAQKGTLEVLRKGIKDRGAKFRLAYYRTPEAMRYKFERMLDMLILDFVHKKLDLYKKLTEPDTNRMFKQKWFEELYRKYRNH